MTMKKLFDRIQNGVILAELGGYGDGPYCAKHGDGSALVMLGSYIVDAGDNVPYDPRFVFKPGRQNYADYLTRHIEAARESGALVGVSVCSVKLEDTLDFLHAAQDAGADVVSYCAHSVMDMFLRENVSSALCRPEHWNELRRWGQTLVAELDRPVIFKIRCGDTPDDLGAVDVLTDANVPIVHANVGCEGLTVIEHLKGRTPFLIAGGGITDIDGARRTLDAGARAIALGAAAMNDPTLCRRLQQALTKGHLE